jgi:hypothetical protein
MAALSGTTVKILDCGAMSCDLTWLLLKPGRTIRSRADKDRPPEWYRASTHCVLVETPEDRMLCDTSCPRDWTRRLKPTGLQEFLEYITGLQRRWERRQRLEDRYPELAGDRRPILAHEGPYSTFPLRAGDARAGTDDADAVGAGSGPEVDAPDTRFVVSGHDHAHPHGHLHSQPERPHP